MRYTQEDIYMTLTGNMQDRYRVPGVEDAFAPGSPCDVLYDQAMDAYERLCQRLGVEDEDADVEIILNNLLQIQDILCQKMFAYGKIMG